MKKLYLKNNGYALVKLSDDAEGKYISVYNWDENPKLLYSVFIGNSTIHERKVLFADGLTELPQYEIPTMMEIIENFNQYFNNLNQ
jgi:hypothetical protein